jgi:molybdopterin converting factor small subunit
MITIELYGVPRLRAGLERVTVVATTLGEALAGLARVCPALANSVIQGGRVHPAYKLSLNGDRFVAEPDTKLNDGDALLLLSADVGG